MSLYTRPILRYGLIMPAMFNCLLLGGVIAGAIEFVLVAIAGRLYLDALFQEAIERLDPALMANISSVAGGIGFVTITLLLGISQMYIYAAMRPRFDGRVAAVVSATLAAWTVESLSWGLIGLIGIFSWWTQGGEAAARWLLIDLYNDEHDKRDVVNSTKGEAGEAFAALNERLAQDVPPVAWRAILGKYLLTYTPFVPYVEEG